VQGVVKERRLPAMIATVSISAAFQDGWSLNPVLQKGKDA
jgi:hypothetical protein